MLSSLLTSSTVSGNHTAVLQAGKPIQDRYLLQGGRAGGKGRTAGGTQKELERGIRG